ncbi:PepSY domain-containing protein [Oceanobacter kriegii]|uniref:PepSY domain-containing protein n=1 Tax=Oceanobacter kriegii TaxID=64972 RepID=UPI00042665E1|nr:PepSY domain-containing protein [Oceanobacter kriegii]
MRKVLMAAAMMAASSVAMAGADCQEHSEAEQMHILDMQKKIVNEYGFAIKKFLRSGDCYEIYGWGLSDDGSKFERIEVYFDTKTGAIVKKEID